MKRRIAAALYSSIKCYYPKKATINLLPKQATSFNSFVPFTFSQKNFFSTLKQSSTLQITDQNFSELVEKSSKPVILDCSAEWCGPCKILGPKLEAEIEKLNGSVLLGVLDVDENPEISEKLRVSSIPNVFAFWKGKIIGNFVGAIDEKQIQKFLKDVVNTAKSN